ncbi:MAG: FKBP-type peptidyl-prolyl cis-trans isomerase [Candidatus Cyclobacteriaceae bacterium M3_2C_046]
MKVFRYSLIIALFASSFLWQGCLEESEVEGESENKESLRQLEEYMSSNNIQAEEDANGFYYEVLQENAGEEVDVEDFINLYYKVSLLNGTVVDSLVQGEDIPFSYRHFINELYPPGVHLGINNMKEGETYRFYLPSRWAYGRLSTSKIPAYASVIFEVHVANVMDSAEFVLHQDTIIQDYMNEQGWENVEKLADGLYFNEEVQGEGDKPKNGEDLKVNYRGFFLDGKEFDKSPANNPAIFRLGGTIKGFNNGLAQMNKGGKGTIIMTSNYAYWEEHRNTTNSPVGFQISIPESIFPAIKIQPFSILAFDVELLNE